MSFASRLRRLSNSFKVGDRPERYHVPARVTLGTRFPNRYGGTGKLTSNEGDISSNRRTSQHCGDCRAPFTT